MTTLRDKYQQSRERTTENGCQTWHFNTSIDPNFTIEVTNVIQPNNGPTHLEFTIQNA